MESLDASVKEQFTELASSSKLTTPEREIVINGELLQPQIDSLREQIKRERPPVAALRAEAARLRNAVIPRLTMPTLGTLSAALHNDEANATRSLQRERLNNIIILRALEQVMSGHRY